MTNKSVESESNMKKWNGNWVAHDCKNPKCNNGFIYKDLTGATTIPPKYAYCKECCEKLGIDFYSQTPDSNLTKEEIEKKRRNVKYLKSKH